MRSASAASLETPMRSLASRSPRVNRLGRARRAASTAFLPPVLLFGALACNGSNGERPHEPAARGDAASEVSRSAEAGSAPEPAGGAGPGSAAGDAASSPPRENVVPAGGGLTERAAPAPGSSAVGPASAAELEGFAATPSGLRFREIAQGSGALPERGEAATIRYSMWRDDGRRLETDAELVFAVGAGRVVRGLDEAVATMRVGGKRRLVLPPALAYGQNGRPADDIPPNATLTLEVELVNVSAR